MNTRRHRGMSTNICASTDLELSRSIFAAFFPQLFVLLENFLECHTTVGIHIVRVEELVNLLLLWNLFHLKYLLTCDEAVLVEIDLLKLLARLANIVLRVLGNVILLA